MQSRRKARIHMLSRAFSATLNNCLDRETGEIMSEQQPEPQAMTSDEAIKTLRRYLPPHLLQEVLAALESEPRLALLEERVSTLIESIALLRETTDTAINQRAYPLFKERKPW